MRMIRQPISGHSRIGLGIAALCLLVVLYAGLSFRQHRRNPKDTTIPNLSQFVEGWQWMVTPDGGRHDWEPRDLWPPTSRVWLVEDVAATYGRLLAGMVVGVRLVRVG